MAKESSGRAQLRNNSQGRPVGVERERKRIPSAREAIDPNRYAVLDFTLSG
jgi:hypothetical protein